MAGLVVVVVEQEDGVFEREPDGVNSHGKWRSLFSLLYKSFIIINSYNVVL